MERGNCSRRQVGREKWVRRQVGMGECGRRWEGGQGEGGRGGGEGGRAIDLFIL
jgi:hypothetical protein